MLRDWTRQVVITGVGVCCNMGDDLPTIAKRLRSGDAPAFEAWQPAVDYNAGNRIIGMYHGELSDDALQVTKKQGRFMGRAARMGIRAARTALAQSGIDTHDLGVVVGSGTGDVETHIHIRRKLDESKACRRVGTTVIPKIMGSTVSANLVNVLHTHGPSVTAAAACAGGAYNILLAAQMIEIGHMDAAIAGGVETTDIHFHAGFDAMRAYNAKDNDHPERASRPYAADRAGFVFGEGGGIVVLESLASARARGANILGVLRGYGMSSDGEGEMVAPSQDGAVRALRKAFQHAAVTPEQIGYVNTHGTSTPVGDVSEVGAIRRAFDNRHLPYGSTKGYTGHSISGAGAIEAIFTLEMMRGGWLAPSVHAKPLDPELEDYPPVLEPVDIDVSIAASNSFGFGGTNACLILAREPHEA